MQILKTDTSHPSFLFLERLLDQELLGEFPKEMNTYAPHNKFASPIKTILILHDDHPIACGAFKELKDYVEIKRMFVHPDYRRKGFSRHILSELETWAKSLGYSYAILETGDTLYKAIQLYTSSGYENIPCFGPYSDLPRSKCFKKIL